MGTEYRRASKKESVRGPPYTIQQLASWRIKIRQVLFCTSGLFCTSTELGARKERLKIVFYMRTHVRDIGMLMMDAKSNLFSTIRGMI